MNEEMKKIYKKFGVMGVIILIIVILISSIKFIGAGYSGIIYNRFSGKIGTGLHQGINFINPFTTKVKRYDLRINVGRYELTGLSSDSQTIELELEINYRLDGEKLGSIYQNIQGNIEETILYNVVVDTSKAELGKFRIEDIARNRESLRRSILDTLYSRMKTQYIEITNVSITNVDFSEQYEKSIEDKLTAEQRALEAKNKKEQVRYESEAKAIENQKLGETITPMVLKQKFIEKWDGKFPNYMGGDSASTLLKMAI